MLENRGYSVQHITNVMTVDLDNAVLDASVTDVLFPMKFRISGSTAFWLKRTTNPIHRSVVPSMYRAILKETVCASITKTARSLPQVLESWIATTSVSMPFMCVKIIAAEDMPVKSVPVFSMRAKRGASHAYLQVVKTILPQKSFTVLLDFSIPIPTGSVFSL